MKNKLPDPSVSIHGDKDLKAYCFRFDGWTGSWANFYIDEKTGTFMICSGWGDFCHRWGKTGHEDRKTFTKFIADINCDYIMDKFSYGRSDFTAVDIDKTFGDIKLDILRLRHSKKLSKAHARIMYLWIKEANVEDDNPDSIYNHLLSSVEYTEISHHDDYDYDDFKDIEDKPFSEIIGIEPYECLYFSMTPIKKFVKNELLPMFKNWLSDHLKNNLGEL